MKKTAFFLVFTALHSIEVQSQTPERISYQAVVRNNAGILLNNKTVRARISILKDSANGTAVYTETHQPKTNANGLMSLLIGGGTVVTGNFANIKWGSGTYYVKQEIDSDGGTNYTISGVNQMLSVPYALHAKNAEKCFQHYIGELYGGGIVFHVWKDTLGAEHGLIVNKYWLGGDTTPWSVRLDTTCGAFSFYDGFSNTEKIVANYPNEKSAAKFCYNLSEGGYEDWYLPSFEELILLIQNSSVIDNALRNKENYETIIPTISYEWNKQIPSSTEYSQGYNNYFLGIEIAYRTLIYQKKWLMLDSPYTFENFRAIRKF